MTINTSAKCKAIPQHIIFFCKQLYGKVVDKFPARADTVIGEFLFDKWILKALCEDANHIGLVTDLPITGVLMQNLSLVRDSLTALISSSDDYEIVVGGMPAQISEACNSRRSQA